MDRYRSRLTEKKPWRNNTCVGLQLSTERYCWHCSTLRTCSYRLHQLFKIFTFSSVQDRFSWNVKPTRIFNGLEAYIIPSITREYFFPMLAVWSVSQRWALSILWYAWISCYYLWEISYIWDLRSHPVAEQRTHLRRQLIARIEYVQGR